VRDGASKIFVELAHRLASDLGWARITDRQGAPSMVGGLLRLRELGFAPKSVVDVGACQGDWTRLLRKVFPAAQVLMVEPQPRHEATLLRLQAASAGKIVYKRVLVGPPGMPNASFYVMDDTSGGLGSSVLPERSGVPRHTIDMPIHTLDDLIADAGLTGPELLKLDVQGFELEVLKGATRALGQARYVLLEVSIVQYNEGSPLIDQVLSWMSSHGYRAVDVFDLSRTPSSKLLQVDLLFENQQQAS
jgi:FkbM family methyltransferase